MSPPLRSIRSHVVPLTVLGTLLGYGIVLGTFVDLLPVYPSIDLTTSTRLSHAIALVNAMTVISLVAGWRWIRRGQVDAHRAAMGTAFALILLFLVLYLTRVGGGGTKEFVGPPIVTYLYLAMLAIHILLSVVAVPLVLYALLLGLSHTPAELRTSPHARFGRLAAGTWLVSLLLGLVTYLMLEHLYTWEYVAAILWPLLG